MWEYKRESKNLCFCHFKEKDFLKVQENLQNEKKERNKIENDLKAIKCEKKDLSNCLKKEKEKSSKLNSKITDLEMR